MKDSPASRRIATKAPRGRIVDCPLPRRGDRQKQDATLNLERDVASKTATTRAESAAIEASANQAQQTARIEADLEIARKQAAARQSQETAVIEADLAVKQRRIQAEQTAALADQDRLIAVNRKSEDESKARASAEQARALATSAEEGVTTARDVAKAERERQIVVIAARQEAERDAAKRTIAATAEKQAANDLAEAVRTQAQADADAMRIRAEGKAREYTVDAEGQRLINEARNTLNAAIIEMELTKERLRIVPLALAEAVKPMEKIGDVKIIDLGGRGIPGATGSAGATGGSASPAESLVNALLAYRLQSPVVDQLLKQVGLDGPDPIKAALSALQANAATTKKDDD